MIKDLILHIERDETRESVCDFAISVAELFEAHLTGVAFSYAANISNFAVPDLPASVLTEIFSRSEAAAREAIERFDTAVKRNGISAEPRLILQSEFGPPKAFSEMARCYDLSVMMQTDDYKGVSNDLLIEATLFESGRPLIVVPYIQKGEIKLDRIVCCWDGSRAAARALNDALPLLKKAGLVELFMVVNEESEVSRETKVDEIANHLARHDVKVQVETVPAADIDVANAILSYVSDVSADLIVMGGYGHSRMREFILGGATRGILGSMTVPVFLSH